MGIHVYISQEIIASILRRDATGKFAGIEISNPKSSPWNEIFNQTIFNSKQPGKYVDLSVEKKMILKIQNENLLPKGGCNSPIFR
jgi:hypothetical protein